MRRGIISSGAGGVNTFSANALALNGSTQYATIPSSAVLNPSALSISFWMKSNLSNSGDGSGHKIILNLGGKYDVNFGSTGNLQVNNFAVGALSYNYQESGLWTHICTTIASGGAGILYIDGVSVDTSTVDRSGSSADTTYIGRHASSSTQFLDADLMLTHFYDDVLTPSEVTDLYNIGTALCFDSEPASVQSDAVFAPRFGNWGSNAGEELDDQVGSLVTTLFGSPSYTGTGLTVECAS